MMNKIIIGLALLGMMFLHSCAKDEELGEIESLTSDYVLPQGKSPADDRIVKLHEKYGSYFLYEFSRRDFDWKLVDVSLEANADENYLGYSYTPADPMYVGDLLDLLDVTWFRFYPETFLKKTIPYRVLLVSTLQEIDLYYEETFEKYLRIDENQIVISSCSNVLREMSGETKRALKNKLQHDLIYDWLITKVIVIPNEFYDVSDYSSNADLDAESENYARHRGFIASWDWTFGEEYEWSDHMSNLENPTSLSWDLNNDVYSYIDKMILYTSEEWEEDLSYPLVKQKYDILRNYFKEHYGFDVKAIGDATYE